MTKYIEASYSWPYNGDLTPENTCLLVIDMQADFCAIGGHVDRIMGNDAITLTRNPIEPIQNVLHCMRSMKFPIIYTREGYLPDLSDCPPNNIWKSKQMGAEIGSKGPLGRILVKGEPGWEIIHELQPLETEVVIDKPSKGAFTATSLDFILRIKNIKNIILTGIATEISVHTTMRTASDLGYECLLLEDCCSSTDMKYHCQAIDMIRSLGSSLGAICKSNLLIETFFQRESPKLKTKRMRNHETAIHKLSRLPTFQTFKHGCLVPCKTKYIQLTCICPKKVRVRTYCVCSPGIIRCNDCFTNHILNENTVRVEFADTVVDP